MITQNPYSLSSDGKSVQIYIGTAEKPLYTVIDLPTSGTEFFKHLSRAYESGKHDGINQGLEPIKRALGIR